MEQPRSTPQGTSLELPSEPRDEAQTSVSPELQLPSSVPPPPPLEPTATQHEPAAGPLGELVVAHFRRVEIAMLGRVLITTLAGALPAAMIRLERRRSLGQRLSGRVGEPIGITITAGERRLSFRAPEVGVAQANVAHVVRDVVLSSTPMPVAQWLSELGELLEQVTRDDEAARRSLERALLG